MKIELLKVIRETENDDLTSVMQRIVITFDQEVTPLAVEMMTHLVSKECLLQGGHLIMIVIMNVEMV